MAGVTRQLLVCGVNIVEMNTIRKAMADNDAYHALKAIDALVMTGPTGTNVNDLTVALIKR